jgi:hypothetical protein
MVRKWYENGTKTTHIVRFWYDFGTIRRSGDGRYGTKKVRSEWYRYENDTNFRRSEDHVPFSYHFRTTKKHTRFSTDKIRTFFVPFSYQMKVTPFSCRTIFVPFPLHFVPFSYPFRTRSKKSRTFFYHPIHIHQDTLFGTKFVPKVRTFFVPFSYLFRTKSNKKTQDFLQIKVVPFSYLFRTK